MSENNKPANEKLDFLRERLADACVQSRHDLSTSRHVFRGKPSYIIHDPVTINSHRFAPREYQILASLSRQKPLAVVFQELVAEDLAKPGDEESFYEFILNLQAKGLLDLPITDSQKLYERYAQTNANAKANLLNKLMFLRIPLVNPNNFLDRTVKFARPLFTNWFFYIWCALIVLSIGIIYVRWDDFLSPFADLLATRSLIIMILVLTALKIWHELGHAYACKISGGIVPDMGAFFMVGMPLAYVDVSSSWSFPSLRSRILVGLGGMYFESIAGAIAVFVWAGTSPGLINSAAHLVVLMASVMTVLFNANPLMRYDGYYILSDALGMPNLRQRSTYFVKNEFKRRGLGLSVNQLDATTNEKIIFVSYGVSAFIYQVVLVVSISVMMAVKFLLLGVILAASFVFGAIVKPILRFYEYLLTSAETQPVRGRATIWAGSLAVAAFGLLLLIPVTGGTLTKGQLTLEHTQPVRLPFDCFLKRVAVIPNKIVESGEELLVVENEIVREQFLLASANLNRSRATMAAESTGEAFQKQQRFFEFQGAEEEVVTARNYMKQMNVKADFGGRVLSCPRPTDGGRYYEAGEEILKLGSGANVVQCLLDSEQWMSANPQIDQIVSVRFNCGGSSNCKGKISRIEPAGSKRIAMAGLTQLAAGDILVDPSTGIASRPYFLIEITLIDELADDIPAHATASVRLGRQFETVGGMIIRRIRILINQVNAG